MTKILVLGATGMLGHKLCQHLPRMGMDVTGTTRGRKDKLDNIQPFFKDTKIIGNLDVEDNESLDSLLKREQPEYVINCVGIIKQLKSAENKFLSIGINAYLPHRLANLCKKHNNKLIHISTDCVFDGTRGNYKEDDKPDAKDLYGITKMLGETDTEETSAVTIRSSIIGRQISEPKLSLIEWFLQQKGTKIKGFNKAIYTGLTTIEMARAIESVIKVPSFFNGVYHVASAPITKYDLLVKLRDLMNINIEIEKDEEFFCDRSLIMEPFTDKTGYAPPSWEEMLQELASENSLYH